MTTATEGKPKHRSVSQLNQYNRCPYSYKLQRIDKEWQRPAAWTAQGSAVHEAIEAWENSHRTMSLQAMQQVFLTSYKKYINASCEITPNFQWWFASGPYDALKDIPRRMEIGLGQCEKYINWVQKHTEEVIWFTPDGTPAIELAFDIELDGIPVRGYIDAIIVVEVKPGVYQLRVRDHKTGNQPGDDFQLGVYKVAIEIMYGESVPSGDYWMGKTGKATYPYDLTHWTRERVTARFKELESKISAGEFPPDPDPDKCKFCDVAFACSFREG
ncbi:exonuclease [Mycobacterium phage HINdeR]|uniref:Cas4 exonuclease n=1 Tax=Mycobacterium phage HINdeR TaxID=1327770 RepID=R4JHS6_9CAUD|nr:exonuclease [Mycobacterium phage HINdeR]AGK87547.1 Cas4 exonuclease [Mycobacterium phage HINdeR]